jgi:hypothetical protein
MNDDDRARFWARLGASSSEAGELVAYARSGFEEALFDRVIECPLPDEPCVAAWEIYAADAEREGAATSLRRHLMQLRFRIAEGMSANPDYVAAVRRGEWTDDAREPGVRFERPDALRVFLHPTAAGRVPVVVTGARADFVALVQAVTCRNEPTAVPGAMGALIVAGYNNWDRVAALGPSFPTLIANKPLYQDRFIILSSGPYSGVPARALGVGDDDWRRMSLTIRLEHECAHYVTRHAFGTMRNAILDEIIADYIGIVSAAGRYRGEWFLRFLGLDEPGVCRAGGRIHSYRGEPPISDGAFALLQIAIRRAALHLETFDGARRGRWDAIAAARMIVAIAKTGLEGLASDDACDRVADALADAARIVRTRALSSSASAPSTRAARRELSM